MKDSNLHNVWNQLGGPKYPHEKVVQYCFRHFSPEARRGVRTLDLGCGSGVHTAFLAREGFHVTAVDLSPAGVDNTRRKLRDEGLEAQVMVMGFESLDLPKRFFELVVCTQVLQCLGPSIAAEGLHRLKASLAPNARGFFQFASDRDELHKASSLGLRGYSREEVDDLFGACFPVYSVDKYLTTYQGGRVTQEEWIVTFEPAADRP